MLRNIQFHSSSRRIGRLGLFAVVVAGATALALGVSQAVSGKSDGTPPLPPGEVDTAPATPVVTHVPRTISGKTWSITTYSNARGDLCAGEKLPDGGQGVGCQPASELFERAPVWLQVGASQRPGDDLTQWNNAWVWGFASASVRSLNLVMTDCSERALVADSDGVFLAVFGDTELQGGIWPYRLDAYGASGKLLHSKRVPLEPPQTEAAKVAGTRAPQPGPACA
jgi:hypothetical protein